MARQPIFLRPLTALTEEEEAAEVAEIVRLVEAALGTAEADDEVSSSPELDEEQSK